MVVRIILLLFPLLIAADLCDPDQCRWDQKCDGITGLCVPDKLLTREEGTVITDCGLTSGRCKSSSCTAFKFPNSAFAEHNGDTAVKHGCTAALACANKGPNIHCWNEIKTGNYTGAYCLQSGNSDNFKICGGCRKWEDWSDCSSSGTKTRQCKENCAITETVACCPPERWGEWEITAESGRCMQTRTCKDSSDLVETEISTSCPMCTAWTDWNCDEASLGTRTCKDSSVSKGLIEVSTTACIGISCSRKSGLKCPSGMNCNAAQGSDTGVCIPEKKDLCKVHSDCNRWNMYCDNGVCRACTMEMNEELGVPMECCKESRVCRDSSCVALGFKNSAQSNTDVDELARNGAVCPAVGACAQPFDKASKCYSRVVCSDPAKKDCYGYGEYCLLDGNNNKNLKICAVGCTNNNWGSWGSCIAGTEACTTCGKVRRRSCLDGADPEDHSGAKRNVNANPSKKALREVSVGDCCEPSCSIASPIVATPIQVSGDYQTVTWTVDILPSADDAESVTCIGSGVAAGQSATLPAGTAFVVDLPGGDATFSCTVTMRNLSPEAEAVVCDVKIYVPSCAKGEAFVGLPESPLNVESTPYIDEDGWSFSMPGSKIISQCSGTNGVSLSPSTTCSASSPCTRSVIYNSTIFQKGTTDLSCTALVYGTVVKCELSQDVFSGATPGMKIVKETCLKSTSLCGDGLIFMKGDAIIWKYTVTNTGNVDLFGLTVIDDDQEITVSPATIETLAQGKKVTFEAEGTATASAGDKVPTKYSNIGTVNAEYPKGTPIPNKADDSWYFGADPSISIDTVTCGTKSKSGCDGLPLCMDDATVITGKEVTWKYTITNTGNVPLSNVQVTDDKAGIVGTTSLCSGDSNNNGILETTETWVFVLSTKIAGEGPYSNMATAKGYFTPSDENSREVSASDGSNYFGVNPQLSITKVTNGADGLCLYGDAPLLWKYTVTRGGNVDLKEVTVVDDKEGALTLDSGDDGDGILEAGETWEYKLSGNAVFFNYENEANVTSETIVDSFSNTVTPSAKDSSRYLTGGSASATLIAGQFHPAGTVTAYFDGESICVLYQLIPQVTLEVVHVWVGVLGVNSLAIDKNGNPAPGQFQIIQEGLSTGSTMICKTAAELQIEEIMADCVTFKTLVITAHAGVTSATLPDFKGQTAWGQGSFWTGSNWAMYFPLKVNCKCLSSTCTPDDNNEKWGEFQGTCSQPCGGGFRIRYREVGYCPPFEDYEACNPEPCVPCGSGSTAGTTIPFQGTSASAKLTSTWDGTLLSVTVNNVPKGIQVTEVQIETLENGNPVPTTSSVQHVITSKMSFKLFGFQVMPSCQAPGAMKTSIEVRAMLKYKVGTSELTTSPSLPFLQPDLLCWCGSAGKDVEVQEPTDQSTGSGGSASGTASWVGWVAGTLVGTLFGAAVAGAAVWMYASSHPKMSAADLGFHAEPCHLDDCVEPGDHSAQATGPYTTPFMSPSRRTYKPPTDYFPVASM